MSEHLVQVLPCPINELTLLQCLIAHPQEIDRVPLSELESCMFSSKLGSAVFEALKEIIEQEGTVSPVSVLAAVDLNLDLEELVKQQDMIVKGLTLSPHAGDPKETMTGIAVRLIERFEDSEAMKKTESAVKHDRNARKHIAKHWEELALKYETRRDEKVYEDMVLQVEEMKRAGVIASLPENITASKIMTETAGGLVRGMPTLISGRSANGKSVVAFNAAIDCAKAGYNVIYVYTENDKRTIQCHLFSYISGIPLEHFGNGDVNSNPDMRNKVWKAWDACSWTGNIQFVCMRAPYVEDVISAIKGNQIHNLNSKPYDVIVVDFIQHLRKPKGSTESKPEYIASNAEELMTLASKQDSALILVSQNNRVSDKRWDVPSDFDEISGSDFLFQAAQGVVFVKKESTQALLSDNLLPEARQEGGLEAHMFKLAVYGSKSKNGRPVARCVDVDGRTKMMGPPLGMKLGV